MMPLWLLLLASLAQAEPIRLSLAEARRLAVANNPDRDSADLAAEIAEIEASRARLDRVNATLSAGAGAQLGYQRPFGGPAATGNTEDWDLRARVDVPLYAGGARQALIDSAEAGARVARLDQALTRRQLERAATTAYWVIKGYELQIEAVEEGLEVTRQSLAIIEAKAKAGLSAGIDVNRSRVDLLSQQESLVQQRSALYGAQQDLLQLLQLPDQALILTDGPPPLQAGSVRLPASPGANRPERDQLVAQAEQSAAAIRLARAAVLPTVGLYGEAGFGSTRQEAGDLPAIGALDEPGADASAGLRLSWNPFDLGQSRDAVRQAELRAAQIEASRRALDAQLAADIRKAAADLSQLRDRAPLVEEQAALARDNLQIVSELYAQGSASILDLFNAQSSFRQARIGMAALSVQLATAEADLQWLLGDAPAAPVSPP